MASTLNAPIYPSELRLGDAVLRLREGRLTGPRGQLLLEPRVAEVLAVLSAHQGVLVTRQMLFDQCWGSAAIGDDSLNRCVYQLRKALGTVGTTAVEIETIAARGYILRVRPTPLSIACDGARRSWRGGLAQVDRAAIDALEEALHAAETPSAEAWGELALLLAQGAEYAPADDCVDLVRRCETAAARALSVDLLQPDARVALSTLMPLFGDWSNRRARLLQVLADTQDHFPARHELAVLEMATGRVSAAVPIIEALLAEDPLAATLHYKRGFHLYCLGERDPMDRVLDNALQLWPRHGAIWQCRTFTLAFTGRAEAALALLDDEAQRPPMPPQTEQFHRLALTALTSANASKVTDSVRAISEAANWQSLAVSAVVYLTALGAIHDAMAVCERYYLREGAPIMLRHGPSSETSINDLHRRVTQPLFLPVTEPLRSHPRFMQLCERIGLTEYWERAEVEPDFLRSSG